MTTDGNKTVVHRFIKEVLSGGNIDAATMALVLSD